MFQGREFSARKAGIHLRMVAYTPAYEPVPDGHLRVVVQVVVDGEPITEDPLHIEVMPEGDFDQALQVSTQEGWDIRPWEKRAVTPTKASKHRSDHAA